MGPEDIEKIFQYVMKKFPEVTKEDIEQKIAEKKEKIGAGYLTDEGAAILVGSDYDASIPFQFLFTFGIDGIHKVTGTEYNQRRFNVDGIHKVTNTLFDPNGFTKKGLSIEDLEPDENDPYGGGREFGDLSEKEQEEIIEKLEQEHLDDLESDGDIDDPYL